MPTPEPRSAEEWANHLATLLRVMYCEHWAGAYCNICAEKRIEAALHAFAAQETDALQQRVEALERVLIESMGDSSAGQVRDRIRTALRGGGTG